MSEKPEESFDDEEDDDIVDADDADDADDLDKIFRDLEAPRKRRASRSAPEPAWRKLERYLEDRHTADLLSDFDDYDIGDGAGPAAKKKGARKRGQGGV